jgi:epoxyqueuosine reductase
VLNSVNNQIKQWAYELGFDLVGITDTDLSLYQTHVTEWLDQDYCADMHFMRENLEKRLFPKKLMPGTKSIICVGMSYFSKEVPSFCPAAISRYAMGKDYHSLIRKRLQKLADKIKAVKPDFQYRAFCDSAPVLEKPLAEKAGLGWIGKNGLLINKKFGSFFFLGELFLNFELPTDQPAKNHCGTCERCINQCPTKAIVKPKTIDARKCISYLTIEHKEEINTETAGHIYGCDECQNICPWNRFAKETREPALKPSAALNNQTIKTLSQWTEAEFIKNTQGTSLKRLGYTRWQRNIQRSKKTS